MIPFHLAVIAAAAITCVSAQAAPAKAETQAAAPARQSVTLAAVFAAEAQQSTRKLDVDLSFSSTEFFKQSDAFFKHQAGDKITVVEEGEVRVVPLKIKGKFTAREVLDTVLTQLSEAGVELIGDKDSETNHVKVTRKYHTVVQPVSAAAIAVEAPVVAAAASVAVAAKPAAAADQPVALAVIGKPIAAPVSSVFAFTAEGSYTSVVEALAKQFGLRVAKAAGREPRKSSIFVKTPNFDNIDDLVDYVRKAIDPVELRFNSQSKTVQIVFDEKAIAKAAEQVQNLISNDAVELNKRYSAKKAQASAGEAGVVQYQFGSGEPVIISSPLKVTDVSFEPGEKISNIVAGDTARWVISTGNSGQGDIVPHVFIKPSDLGLETTAVVTTDRRTYTMTLRAAAQGHMQRVGFTYPKATNTAVVDIVALDSIKKAEKAAADEERRERERGIDVMDPAGLDFNYKIEVAAGNPSFVPTRVFSNTKKTVITFSNAGGEQAPALFSVADDGSLELLNYRWKGTSIVADEKLKRAALVIGIDDKQQRVDIILDGTSPARKKIFGIL